MGLPCFCLDFTGMRLRPHCGSAASRSVAGTAGKRQPDSRARQPEFKGLLGSRGSEDDSGLLDVWFERKGGSGKGSGGKGSDGKAGERRR